MFLRRQKRSEILAGIRKKRSEILVGIRNFWNLENLDKYTKKSLKKCEKHLDYLGNLGYNKTILRCTVTLVVLNLQYFKRDSYIVEWMSGLRMCSGRQQAQLRLPT